MRRDHAYWARLRRDGRSALAVGAALVACLAALLGVLGLAVTDPSSHGRGNPLYWLMVLPFAWWAAGLARYEPNKVRALKPALAVAVIAALASLVGALLLDREPTPWLIAAVVAVGAAAASLALYRDSMLAREGPAR